jgi:hypothetical protein
MRRPAATLETLGRSPLVKAGWADSPGVERVQCRSYRPKDQPRRKQYDQNEHKKAQCDSDFIRLVVPAEATGARLT